MAEAKRDNNYITTLLGVSNVDGLTPVVLWADPVTHRLLIDNSGSGLAGFETPVGTINGVNDTFTVSYTPKAVILNGVTYFENDGYTLSTLTITMLVIPVT